MAEFRSKDNFGMDAELAAREAAKYDPALEAMVVAFLEEITGLKKNDEFLKWLKDGKVLCAAVNAVKPGSVAKVNDSTMPFKQMENIANFLKACREKLGMRENDLFTTADVFDEKSIVNTLNGLVSFSRAATKSGFAGPSIAPKEAATGSAKPKWEVSASGSSEVSKMSMGSSQTMEKVELEKRGINFGNTAAGSGLADGVSKMNLGSSEVMEGGHIDRSRDINFGNKSAGGAGSSEVSKMSMGSSGTMDRPELEKRGVAFGHNAGKKN